MKVLLIDDSVAISALLGDRLTSLGHEIHTAPNGAVGVDSFRILAPDLVLMDLEMPVLDGFGATRQIREIEALQRWAWTPVVFLTASNTEGNLLKAIEAGADDFLPKSAPMPVLVAKMHAMERIATLRRALREANQELERMANCDGLTGLANRRALDEAIDTSWRAAVVQGHPYGILLIDVDHFKLFNDRYGHLAGDDCLQAIARLLQAACWRVQNAGICSSAFAARYGGEEFCLVFPDITLAPLEAVARRILEDMRERGIEHSDNAGLGVVTLSIGIGHVDLAHGRVAQLFRDADRRLYVAKAAGRNTLVSGKPEDQLESAFDALELRAAND